MDEDFFVKRRRLKWPSSSSSSEHQKAPSISENFPNSTDEVRKIVSNESEENYFEPIIKSHCIVLEEFSDSSSSSRSSSRSYNSLEPSTKQKRRGAKNTPCVTSSSSDAICKREVGQHRKQKSHHSFSPDTTVPEAQVLQASKSPKEDKSMDSEKQDFEMSVELRRSKSPEHKALVRSEVVSTLASGSIAMRVESRRKSKKDRRRDDSRRSGDDHIHNEKSKKRGDHNRRKSRKTHKRFFSPYSRSSRSSSSSFSSSSSSSSLSSSSGDSEPKRTAKIPKSYLQHCNGDSDRNRFHEGGEGRTKSPPERHEQRRDLRRHRSPTGTHRRRRDTGCHYRRRHSSQSKAADAEIFPKCDARLPSIIKFPGIACASCHCCSNHTVPFLSFNAGHKMISGLTYRDQGLPINWNIDRKVYIGGLDPITTRQDIRHYFSKYGHLTNLWVAKNPPGFAFVEYDKPEEAREAVRRANGVVICGSKVKVQMSNGVRQSSSFKIVGHSRERNNRT